MGFDPILGIFAVNHLCKPDIQAGPYGNVQQKDDIDVHFVMTHPEAACDEACRNQLDKYQRLSGSEAHSHELVVDVGTVRQERTLAPTYAAYHHTDDIQTGYQ